VTDAEQLENFAVELWPIAELEPHPRNPQHGDIGAIATAIAVDGWHGAVIAQSPRGRRKRPRLIAGEHRWRGLAALQRDGIDLDGTHHDYEALRARVILPPAGYVPVQQLDISDEAARRKLLADNRASALATQDAPVLIDLLQELAASNELLGSLYDGEDLDALLKSLEEGPGPQEGDAKTQDLPALWSVVIECTTEAEQLELLDEFAGRGLNVRAIIT
jgi:hypothetical protein